MIHWLTTPRPHPAAGARGGTPAGVDDGLLVTSGCDDTGKKTNPSPATINTDSELEILELKLRVPD